jgi:S-adenosylmethionine hydrolase
MKNAPIIALLTDFGFSDAYVASMKGVLLSLLPTVRIVDISHHVTAQNTDEAAFLLWSVYKYFPKRTIFVCVVDPGVGSERRILCIDTGDYYFFAPDNEIGRAHV